MKLNIYKEIREEEEGAEDFKPSRGKGENMDLQRLSDSVKAAEAAMVVELKKRWPEDSIIKVFLQSRQKHPSTMMVMSHSGQGYVRCSMDSKKARFGKFVKDIYFLDIV